MSLVPGKQSELKTSPEKVVMKLVHIPKGDHTFIEKQCPRYPRCDAPLCPLDQDIGKGMWFAEEPICPRRQFGQLDMIKTQRKIKKRAGNRSHYFTVEMCTRHCRIRKGIKGLSPSLPRDNEPQRVKRWLARHPPERGISEEERRQFGHRMKQFKDNTKRHRDNQEANSSKEIAYIQRS